MTGKVHMWMWFHTAVGDRALFESWTITDGGSELLHSFLLQEGNYHTLHPKGGQNNNMGIALK